MRWCALTRFTDRCHMGTCCMWSPLGAIRADRDVFAIGLAAASYLIRICLDRVAVISVLLELASKQVCRCCAGLYSLIRVEFSWDALITIISTCVTRYIYRIVSTTGRVGPNSIKKTKKQTVTVIYCRSSHANAHINSSRSVLHISVASTSLAAGCISS